MPSRTPLTRARTALAAAGLALLLASCGGDETAAPSVSTAATQTPPPTPTAATATPADVAAPATATPPDDTGGDAATPEPTAAPTATEPPSPTTEPAVVEGQARPAVQRLSASEAVSNAEANINALTPAQENDNVLDIEVLAVGDGSIQTLRDVVVGDRPVLLWFYSPH